MFGLLSSSGHLDPAEKVEDAHPKLWCALNEGKVTVFDASSWTIYQHCFKVGTSKLVSKHGALRHGGFPDWAVGMLSHSIAPFGKQTGGCIVRFFTRCNPVLSCQCPCLGEPTVALAAPQPGT